MVGAARLRRRACRRPRQRQVARPMRAVVARRSGRSLRRHRMGGGAAVVQRQCRAARHFLFRHQSMVRRQSAAAVVKSDHSLGGICRSVSRRALPRRPPVAVHDQLVHRAYAASRIGARVAASAGRLAGQHAYFWLHNNLDSGAFRGAQAQWDKINVPMLSRRQLVGHGLASARQYRGVHARGDAAQEIAHPSRLARASVLHRGRPARSNPLFRLLAQRHRQRRDGRAAGQARDPQRRRRLRMAPRARMAARAHALDQVLSRSVAAAGRGRGACRQAGSWTSPPRRALAQLCRVEPRLDGLDVGGGIAGDGRRHQAGDGSLARDRRSSRSTPRSPGRSPPCCGCRVRARTWIYSSRCAISIPTARK